MDRKTKINTIISLVLVTLIAGLAYWAQIPTKDLKAELIDTDTVLVRIQDFAFDPDVVRIEPETTVSWLHDEGEGNADVQHAVASYDPEDTSAQGEEFESDIMNLGDTFSHTFNDSGVYYYNCSLHPFMTGKICVGDESEELDDDCAIDTGIEEDTLADEEEDTLTDEDEDVLADEDEDILADDEDEDILDEDLVDEDILADTDEDIVEDDDLSPAADEDFDASADTSDTTTIVLSDNTESSTTSATASQDELASSGPEDSIYLFVALFAIYMGRKLARNQA